MPRYRFTGLDTEVFPSIVLGDDIDGYRTLVCEPGDEVDLAEPVEHPRLEPLDAPPPAPPADPAPPQE